MTRRIAFAALLFTSAISAGIAGGATTGIAVLTGLLFLKLEATIKLH